jgi:hypothetical protein
MVVLHEAVVDAGLGELPLVVALDEEAALVAME